MKTINNKNKEKGIITLSIICVLIISLFATAMTYLLQYNTSIEYKNLYRKYKVGMICEDSLILKSDIDIINEQKTEKLRKQNYHDVLPVFVYSINTTSNVIEEIDKLRSSELNQSVVSVAYEIAKEIMDAGFFNDSELTDYQRIDVINKTEYSLDVNENVITRKNLPSVVDSKLLNYSDILMTSDDLLATKIIVEQHCKPNVFYDEILTNTRRDNAYDETEPVVHSFKKGQVILQPDTVITDEQIQILIELGNRKEVPLFDIISAFIFSFIGLCLIFSILYYVNKNDKFHRTQILILVTIITLITIVASYFGQVWCFKKGVAFSEVSIPMCLIPACLMMISGRKIIGFICVFITEYIVSTIPGTDYYTYFYIIFCGIAACYSIQFMNRRLDMFKQCLFNLISNVFFTAAFMLLKKIPLSEIPVSLLLMLIITVGTHFFLAIFVPVFERLFNLPTTFRLHELAYGDSPLIDKLSQAAPGTYNHSRNVAELAEKACRDIGANSLLARVGALYHDIGKMDYPEYFVENQNGDNLHEDLNPSLSVSIIKNHIKAGADKARESGLPAEVVDIIANHHGNDVISYFYNEAKKQSNGEDNVSKIDFSYNNGDLPTSKECAIVMFADGVEAAARTVQDPTPAKFSKIINNIVYGKIDRGQLKKCVISMKEIDTVCESFLKTLTAVYHSRIQYPDEDKK